MINKRKNGMENKAKDRSTKEDAEQSTQRYEVKYNSSQTVLLKHDVDKIVRLDPTRYGDWEKNGRCIGF